MIDDKIIQNIISLKYKFEKIAAKGYIKGIYNNNAAIGRTFENELNLNMNKESVPDYHGIELKTRRTYSKSMITLFNAVPDGDKPLELNRIRDRYGWPYKRDKEYKALYAEVYGNIAKYAGIKYKYKLEVNKQEEKIYLCIYDKEGDLVEKEVYWSFDYLKEKLINKLQVLALIEVWPNKINGWNYFKYYKINFYTLKGFDTFISLIEIGIIKLSIKIDIYMDKENYGKMYDHGCGFSIAKKDINLLFSNINFLVNKHEKQYKN